MLLIDCPYCGPRPEIEFHYGGEAHLARPAEPDALDDRAWTSFLYDRTNPKGLHVERWRHVHGCARFFNAIRDTVADSFVRTYRCGEPVPVSAPTAGPGAAAAPEEPR
jgi:sarcosine oxidase, subunit delta